MPGRADGRSLFEAAGGAEAMRRLAEDHHERCLADPELNHPFSHDDLDPAHVEHLAAYWTEVLGGPATYSTGLSDQTALLVLHTGHGEGMYDLGERFVRCFDEAVAAQLPADEDLRRALHAYMVWAVADVTRYAPRGSEVPPGQQVPRWGWDGLELAG